MKRLISLSGEILCILKEGNLNVSELIDKLNSGPNKHSATTISNHLNYLKEENLVKIIPQDGMKRIQLTEKGKLIAELLEKINQITEIEVQNQ